MIETTAHRSISSSVLDDCFANSASQDSSWKGDLQHAQQLQASGDLKDALSLCERLLRRNPAAIELWVATAEVLLELDELEAALDCLRQALLIDADDPSARVVLGNIQLQLGNISAAEEHYRFVLKREPEHVVAMGNLASLLQSRGEIEEAIVLSERVAQLLPHSPQVLFNHGNVLFESGQLDAAREQFQAALPKHPRPAKVLHNLLKTIKATQLDRSTLSGWEQLAEKKASTRDEQIYLHFAKGKIADDHEEHDTAFSHYRQANDLVPVQFDIEAHQRWVDETCELWTPEFLNARASWGNETTAPIFIVGMPRSGTTLVEQILSAHSQVQACGERTALGEQITALGNALGCGTETISTAQRCTQADVYEFAQNYLTVPHRTEQPYFTDKMPTNFLHLGWIALCFPEAKIISCQRDLRDVCLSCYFQHFTHQLPYAYQLETLGAYARESVRLMNHWQSVLPGRMINVSYKELVESPEQEIRRLLQACHLEEEQACFQPHLKRRTVATASAWQVSQPIYKTSQRRWEQYQQHLQPLFESLRETALMK